MMTIAPQSEIPKELILFARHKGISIEEAIHISRALLERKNKYVRQPVGIREFIESPCYMKAKGLIYPEVMIELEKMNTGDFTEVILTGSIGAAKTTAAVYTQAYQLYLLSCLASPHAEFQLDPSTEIIVVIQSLNMTKAKEVGYDRLRNMIDAAPYFQEFFPYNKDKESQMEFPNRIVVKPVAGHETATIGENVIGGLIDEVNYMNVVEKSKKSIDGEQYDQAQANYDSLALRRKNRFMSQGKQPGILCLVSSRRYPGQFTDKKEEEAKREIERTGKTTIYIYDKRSWDIHDESRYSGEKFNIFIGDMSRKAKVMDDDEIIHPGDEHLVVPIPEEFREDFERDMNRALRDVAGVSTLAKHPYISNTNRTAECFGTHKSILSLTETDFLNSKPSVYPKRFYKPEVPRALHIDLGLTGDAAGIACGMCDGFEPIQRSADGEVEMLHKIRFDFTLRVCPPKGGEIIFEQIRALIYVLRKAGLNIKWISLDSFQSTDMKQILRSKGFSLLEISTDKTNDPYDFTKSALMDRRVMIPVDMFALKELNSLELDLTKGKKARIDHPPHGSKDVADAMAGVTFNLSMQRRVYAMYGIPPSQMPQSIRQVAIRMQGKIEEQDARTERSRADGDIVEINE